MAAPSPGRTGEGADRWKADNNGSSSRSAPSAQVSLKAHPIADLFPLLEGEELQALADDIKENGLQEAILVFEGEIIDGRNRWRACEIAGVTPATDEYRGLRADIPARIISKNLRRRHLTTDQRAAIAAEIANRTRGGDRKSEQIKASNGALVPVTDAQAAKLMNVGERTVERAKARMRSDPEAHAKAKAGTLGRAKPKPPEPKPEAIEGLDYEVTTDQWGFRHRQKPGRALVDRDPKPAEPKKRFAWLFVIDEAKRVLDTMAKVAKAAEQGDKAAAQQIIHSTELVTDLCARLAKWAQQQEDARPVEPEPGYGDAATGAEIIARNSGGGLAPEQASPKANGAEPAPDDLRCRLCAILETLKMSETRFAKHADMSQGTLNRFMLGIGTINQANRAKIEAAVADLAGYANATG
jgi:hypothetical protein